MPIDLKDKEKPCCQVCGERDARFNYQAFTCEKCRVFFFRVIMKNQKFPECDKTCDMVARRRRNCKTCRYKKCLEVGMKPQDVGKRVLIHLFNQSQNFEAMLNYHSNLFNYGWKISSQLEYASGNAITIANRLLQWNRQSLYGDGNNITESEIDLDISIADLIKSPGKCSTRGTRVFYPISIVEGIMEVDYRTCWARSATAFVEFMAALPEFNQLDIFDQILMIQSNYLVYTLCEVLFKQFHCRRDNNIPYSYVPYSNRNTPSDYWNQRATIYHSYTMNPIDEMLSIGVEDTEYILIRTIAMFSNVVRLSSRGLKIVIGARERYTRLLGDLIRSKVADLKGFSQPAQEKEAIKRVSGLLRLVKYIQELSIIGKEKHSHMVINNYGDMDSRLTREFHVHDDKLEDLTVLMKLPD